MKENRILETWKAPLRHVGEVWKPWVQRCPEKPVLLDANGSWNYVQLQAVVEAAGEFLRGAGVRAGDRVMLVCENSREFVALFFAVTGLDAWPVLVNARLSAQELEQIREHSGARRVVYTVATSPRAMKHARQNGAELHTLQGMRKVGIGPLNEAAQPEPLGADPTENVAALIYTSGTTGQPKGVMLTHRNVLFIAVHSARLRAVGPEDRLLGILPMSHAVGLSVVLLGTLIAGGSLYLSSHFDPPVILAALEKEEITILMGAPPMFALLAEFARLKKMPELKFPKLRIITSSGAPLQPAVKAETERLFGMALGNGYGVSECSPTIALTRPEVPRKDTSVGQIFPDISIRLVGQDGKDVPNGEVGELWVKGPNVMKGYYRAPEETATAINPEGWFNTRDLARMADQHLFIEGRTKELIVRFGFNVYPAEVEAVLNACTGVARSAVIGRTVAGDEKIIAFVQLSQGSMATIDDIAKHAAKNLAPYKHPTQVILVNEMPVTPTGKVAKDQLRKRWEAGMNAATWPHASSQRNFD